MTCDFDEFIYQTTDEIMATVVNALPALSQAFNTKDKAVWLAALKQLSRKIETELAKGLIEAELIE